MFPVIKRMADPELLGRCADMGTQNANESFNSLVWRRASKTVFYSRSSVEIAVFLAVISFNAGPHGISLVFKNLGLSWTNINQKRSDEMLLRKTAKAEKKEKNVSKWKRKNAVRIANSKQTEKGGSDICKWTV